MQKLIMPAPPPPRQQESHRYPKKSPQTPEQTFPPTRNAYYFNTSIYCRDKLEYIEIEIHRCLTFKYFHISIVSIFQCFDVQSIRYSSSNISIVQYFDIFQYFDISLFPFFDMPPARYPIEKVYKKQTKNGG